MTGRYAEPHTIELADVVPVDLERERLAIRGLHFRLTQAGDTLDLAVSRHGPGTGGEDAGDQRGQLTDAACRRRI